MWVAVSFGVAALTYLVVSACVALGGLCGMYSMWCCRNIIFVLGVWVFGVFWVCGLGV